MPSPESRSAFLHLVLLFLVYLLHVGSSAAATTIGITYSSTSPDATANATAAANTTDTSAPSLPPDRVSAAVYALKIPAVRISDPTPNSVRAFLFSNTSLLLSIPNTLVPSLAKNRSVATAWLFQNVIPFHPRARISAISVGNSLLESNPDAVDLLLPAIRNVDSSLRDLGIHHISVSTTFSFVNIMTGAFPPSSATFEKPLLENLIRPLLDFLKSANSSFMVNIYPYNLYRLKCEIPLGFALFQNEAFMYRDDLVTGARYWNLFDMMVDSVVAAMAVAGHEDVPIIVAETGWPSSSPDKTELDANADYAEMYIRGLLKHLRSAMGTPLRKEGVAEAYIYELVDKEVKPSGDTGRSWGILYPNLTRKYQHRLEFSCAYRLVHCGDTVVSLLLLIAFAIWMICYVPVYTD
ncbi:hypothetical protein SAY86_030766 [Trapa natans]|uniref:glucan endo-1,3-beta-D-glucosidase n=1 Tax=Trapa natans TaxID=22666 RepID=A0AAN7RDX4_TRANT|nr:hypothetical protein SAY86_030766 [Trapa natans]